MWLRLIEDEHKNLFVLSIKGWQSQEKPSQLVETYSKLCLQSNISCLKAAH